MTSMIKPDILMYKTTATRNSTIIQHTATAAAFIYSSMLIAEVIKYYRVWLLPTPATETKYYRVRLLPARDPESSLPTSLPNRNQLSTFPTNQKIGYYSLLSPDSPRTAPYNQTSDSYFCNPQRTMPGRRRYIPVIPSTVPWTYCQGSRYNSTVCCLHS